MINYQYDLICMRLCELKTILLTVDVHKSFYLKKIIFKKRFQFIVLRMMVRITQIRITHTHAHKNELTIGLFKLLSMSITYSKRSGKNKKKTFNPTLYP